LNPTWEDVDVMVRRDAKQRFTLSEDGFRIRAAQGHTMRHIKDQELLERICDSSDLPEEVVHGTYMSCWPSIRKEGLRVMKRNHVDFARTLGRDAQVVSGSRSDAEVAVWLDLGMAVRAGMIFYTSANGVVLTRGFDGVVPPTFFRRVVAVETGELLWPPDDASTTADSTSIEASSIIGAEEEVDVAAAIPPGAPGAWRPGTGLWRARFVATSPSQHSLGMAPHPQLNREATDAGSNSTRLGAWRPGHGAWRSRFAPQSQQFHCF